MKKRITVRSILFVGGGITLLFFSLIGRIFYLQVVQADWLNESAMAQWQREEWMEPQRGMIMDRNGQPLAYSGPAYTVVAVLSEKAPSRVENPMDTAEKLAPILQMSKESLLSLLSKKDRYQVELRPGGWKIDESKAKEIEALRLPGIYLSKSTKRYYPNQAFLSPTLGYVDKEGEAKMGLELMYDSILRGTPGKGVFLTDRSKNVLPAGVENYQPAVDGKNLRLTVDERIQHFAEQALDDAASRYRAKGMMVLVADPNTMEMLAIASRPDFDPNQYTQITDYRNLPLQVPYEPGSTFKVITLAASIEEGVFHPDEVYQAGRYESKVIRPAIKDYYNNLGWGKITFRQGIERSSNVGAVILGFERLGKEKLFQYYKKFGFGEPTGIDYPHEGVGKLPPPNAPPRDIATTTFGQAITVTAIEQLRAVSAAINGGKLLRPYLVKEILDPKTGKVLTENKPVVERQVISPETSSEVRKVLEGVITSPEGTGRGYAIEGYRIGGKTGTAQKPDVNGSYSRDKFIYSFVGFAPVDNPRLIVYAVVDEPDMTAISSSQVVGEIFRSVMKNSLQYLQIPPDASLSSPQNPGGKEKAASLLPESQTAPQLLTIPTFVGEMASSAKQKALELGLKPVVLGKGKKVTGQYPQGNEEVMAGQTLYLVTDGEVLMPDLTGVS
ncbi:Penicillin-binding protein transpeptidase [[Clostridium] ultunense Esp]|nr:Penicillin-binding protein transpeptidase [[Clostridium] ultunense Esp]